MSTPKTPSESRPPRSETEPADPELGVSDPLDPEEEAEEPAEASPAYDRGLDAGMDFGAWDEAGAARGGGLTEMVRKAMVAGLGAVFMTEEGIRALVKDLKLPKDVMGFLVGQADRSKTELMRVVSQELRRFFESPALRAELSKLLSNVVVEVKAEIRLKPSGEPDVKVRSTTTRRASRRSDR